MCKGFILRLQRFLTEGDDRPKREAEVNTIGRRLRRVVVDPEELRDTLSRTSDVVKEKDIIQQYAEDLVSRKENLKEIKCCLLYN